MAIERSLYKPDIAKNFFAMLLVLFSLYPIGVYAAASITLQRPVAGGPGSGFGWRGSRPHKGTDYPGPVGRSIAIPPGGIDCRFEGTPPEGKGWGQYAVNTQSCDSGGTVTQLFAHLSVCQENPPVMKTGGGVGTYGSGRTTGPHLHYEIWLPDGTRVDAEAAYGQNLCDPAVQKKLAADAQQKLRGRAGGGGGTTAPSNPTQPSTGGGSTGGGSTGGGNTGGGGSTVTVGGGGNYNPPPPQDHITSTPLPPTIDDLVPRTTTNNEVTGCGVDTWTAMVNQSVLQTRREMLVNERYIAKADSVLVYSCFQDMYWAAGDTLGVFSESQRWKNAQVDIIGKTVTLNVDMGTSSLDGAIVNAVDEAVMNFIDMNFDHGVLGEINQPVSMSTTPAAPPSNSSSGDDDDDGASQYGLPCGTMREVWQLAKCMNIMDDPTFFKFTDLINVDPRQFPANYKCNDTGITQKMIDTAAHKDVANNTWGFDKVQTYLDMIYPQNGQCAPPIPTGVTVTTRGGSGRISQEITYDDALCVTAGCSYQNPGQSGLGTCEIKGP